MRVRKRREASILLVVSVVIAMAIAAVSASDAETGNRTPRLPVLEVAHVVYSGDVGDPVVLPVVSGAVAEYYLYGTDDLPAHVPTASSTDLATWQGGPDALPVLPEWANPDPNKTLTWAPAALQLGDRYLLYVSVQERASARQCIAVTTSTRPLGPFRDATGKPLVCQVALGGSIDPSVSRDSSGSLHLTWKSDGNCCGLATTIWEQSLTADGLAVSGLAHRLLTANQPWQGGIVENPALLAARHGGWWLFYSGNRFDLAAYGTGLAYCPNLDGPCQETSDHPFLMGTDKMFSPGGLDFFTDARGQLWATFATWSRPPRNGRFYCCRPVSAARVLSH